MLSKYISRTEQFFLIVGVLLVSALVFFLYSYNEINQQYPLYVTIFLNIMVTLHIWLGCRIIVNYLWIKFPWEKHPLKHLIIEVILILSWATIIMSIAGFIFNEFSNNPTDKLKDSFGLVIGLLITLLVTSIHEGVFFYNQWKNNFNLSIKLKKDNLEARYETLKAQLNPHFLFNSLNTLITYVDDNPKAADYIQNLSDFLRCVLKNKDKEVITISEELEACETYMFLQKARFGKSLEWKVDLSEEIKNMFVAPLTIQMLLENAIKHNIISKEKALVITIGSEKNDYLYVQNNKQIKISESSTGIGLKNIMDRYEYLSSNKPVIIENASFFTVMIPVIFKTI